MHPCQESRASPSHPPLRGDVPPTASRRIAFCVATYRQLRRDAVLGDIGRTVTSYVGWLVDRRKGKNVNVNVNLKCFSMLPEGEVYNRV